MIKLEKTNSPLTLNQRVVGSIPTAPTTPTNGFSGISLSLICHISSSSSYSLPHSQTFRNTNAERSRKQVKIKIYIQSKRRNTNRCENLK